ncbi:hypothetical protein [Orenia marismortui]|uniref:hypothetical protein n=1 Tax=Orenia marismortui TaxID=46469 RepID=UPI00037E9480|nr:hypothetical protein [Orenia marismortui]
MSRDFNYLNKEIIKDKEVIKGLINKELCSVKNKGERGALVFIEVNYLKESNQEDLNLELIPNIINKNQVFFNELYRWHDDSYLLLTDRVYEGDLKVIVSKIKRELQCLGEITGIRIFLGVSLLTPNNRVENIMDRLFNSISIIY